MIIVQAIWGACRALLFLLPPALALILISPALVSPFVNDRLDFSYVFIAGPLYFGLLAAPGYTYAFFADSRAAGGMSRLRARWVRGSLVLALVASSWGALLLAPLWLDLWRGLDDEAWLFALLPTCSTLTSAMLLFRFEFGRSERPYRDAEDG